MFYSPEEGLDIDGAWIDMNEPSNVSPLTLLAQFEFDVYASSSVTYHAKIHSSKRSNRRCLLTEQLHLQIMTHPSL